MIKKYSQVIFDSRISRKITEEDLKLVNKITEDQLNFLVRLYQAYRKAGKTQAPTIETFFGELVFTHIELFKTECNYYEVYPKEKK